MEKNNLIQDMEVYVCTALIGDYDFLLPVNFYTYNKNWNYVCFSDKKRKIKGWEFKDLPRHIANLSPFLKSRYIKIFCQSINNKPGIYIYIDANVQLQKKFGLLHNKFIESGFSLGLFSHPDRKNIFEEFERTLAVNKLNNNELIAKNQMKNYSEDVTFAKTNLLFENNIIFKKSDDNVLETLMNNWWLEIIEWPTRDQFSLPYVVYKSNIKYYLIDLDKRKENDFVFIHGHKSNNIRNIHAYIFARRNILFYKLLLYIWQPFHNLLIKIFKIGDKNV